MVSPHRPVLDVIDAGDTRRPTQLILILAWVLILIRRPVRRVIVTVAIIVAIVRRRATVDLADQSFGVELLGVGRPLERLAHHRPRGALLGGHHLDGENLGWRRSARLLLLHVTHFGVFALASVSERGYWLYVE